MKTILYGLDNGTLSVSTAPSPEAGAGTVLTRSRASLISSGTERMLLEFGRASWIEKARQQPTDRGEVPEALGVQVSSASSESAKPELGGVAGIAHFERGIVQSGSP